MSIIPAYNVQGMAEGDGEKGDVRVHGSSRSCDSDAS